MRTTVPAKTTVTCDRCHNEIKDRGKCSVICNSDGLDYLGMPVGRGEGGNHDYCYKCYTDVLKFLRGDNR